jgi:DNA-binding transcriptional regulator YdaS (Cro superfamily)
MSMDNLKSPIERACDAVGGQVELAKAMNVTPQAINQWVTHNRIPANRVIEIERLTGVSRHALRPDVFGEEGVKPRRPRKVASA